MTRRTRVIAGIAALAASGAVLSGCSAKSNSGSGETNGTPTQGGTVRYAEYPGAYPTAIWPFVKPNQETTQDTSLFQYQFYRPLYMYGVGDKVQLNATDSLAQAPVWSADGKSITITMKGWKWSNGETVDAQDVLFWLNMAHAEKANSAYYTPPNSKIGADYFPDNVVSATADGNTLTLNLDKAYSQTWYLENQLTQITPMPTAWDMTSATTKGTCATGTYGAASTDAACTNDWKYLSVQSTNGASFVSSPLWTVVDGPFKLKTYNVSSGAWSMVPNSSYSGSDKPYLDEIDFVPFTSDTAEDASLRTGSSGANGLDIGYLDQADQPVYNASNPNADNPVKNKGYVFAPMDLINGIQYYELNFANTDTGPMLSQAYFKRAIQETVDQVGQDSKIYKGWTFPTTGAIPNGVGDIYSSTQLNANTFNVGAAKALLTSHGWDTSTTPATCTSPGTAANECGAGVTKGEKAEYTLDYLSGNSSAQLEAEDMQSDAAQAGIKIDLNQKSENAIGNEDAVCAGSTKSGCWQALLYGGWVYAPQVDPTGEPLFMTGAGANTESYSDPAVDKLIYDTTTQSAASVMDQYEDALSQDQPVIYIPNTYGNVGQPFIPEVVSNLHVGLSDPMEGYEPQLWYYTKN
jgi:peptide/nickel transport system substrate-binding protein